MSGSAYAIILGGGRSARMGRAKRELSLAGRSLLARAVAACAERAAVVVVTPDLPADVNAAEVLRTCENPPFGGPVAGIAAGLAVLPASCPDDEVLLLACDLARVADVVRVLDSAVLGPDGACLVDGEQYPQYLAARYRRPSLEATVSTGDLRDRSVTRTLGGLRLAWIPAPDVTGDLDTPEQAEAAGVTFPRQ